MKKIKDSLKSNNILVLNLQIKYDKCLKKRKTYEWTEKIEFLSFIKKQNNLFMTNDDSWYCSIFLNTCIVVCKAYVI